MDENKRLVVELTRLDRPGTPAGAVAVLLEMHPGTVRRTKNGVTLQPGDYITKPARYDEGDLSREHEYKRGIKKVTVTRMSDWGEEIQDEIWKDDIVIRPPITELVDDKRHRLQGYVGLMAAGVPFGRMIKTTYKLPDGSKETKERWERINHAHKDVRAVVGLVVDIDLHNYTSRAEMREQVQRDTAALWYMWQQGDSSLPIPAIEDSGRGIHLWWVFNQAIPYEMETDSARWYTTLANAVKSEVGNIIKSLPYKVDIDSKATAAYRVYNLPGSRNDATDTMRQIINDDWQTVDVDEFCSAAGVPAPGEPLQPTISVSQKSQKRCYNPSLSEDKPEVDGTAALQPETAPVEVTKPGKAVYLPNTATHQHSAYYRVDRLVAWAAGRNYQITGLRNEWIACIVSILTAGAGLTLTPKDLQQYNQLLPNPLSETELAGIIKTMSVYPLPMYNKTIAGEKHLKMTDEEIAALKMVTEDGDSDGKRIRPQYSTPWMAVRAGAIPDTRQQNRTRDKERAKRKAEKVAKYEKIPQLKAEGKKQKEIAALLGISLRTVKQHWHD